MLQARESNGGAVIADQLRPAHTHWTRMKGLLGTKTLPQGHGLWIKPCNQVHMFFMRYAVDLLFLDDDNRVVRTIEALEINKISPKVKEANSVVELPVGTIARSGIAEGAVLAIEGDAEASEGTWLETAGAIGCNVLMALLYAVFAYQHILIAGRYGQWATAMPIVAQESLLVFLFLTRRRSREVSTRPFDWILGIVGTALPLFVRPTVELGQFAWVGQPIQMIGLAFAVVGTVSLGRSVGIVAGNRGIKTSGMHGLVRHPMYMGYIIGYVGYVIAYPSSYNVLIIIGTLIALNGRAIVEERFLRRDPVYQTYLQRVRWRFVPYVY